MNDRWPYVSGGNEKSIRKQESHGSEVLPNTAMTLCVLVQPKAVYLIRLLFAVVTVV